MNGRLGNAARFSLTLVLLQFIVLCLFVTFFLGRAPDADGPLAISYFLTLPSYYYMLMFLVVLLMSPLSLYRITRPFLLVPLLLIQCYLLADIFVFDIYQFHINQMLIDMFIFDFQGIGIPLRVLLLALTAMVVLAGINLWTIRLSSRLYPRGSLLVLPLMFGLFLYNQGLHIWGSGFNQRSITQFSPYMPLYFPITSSGTVSEMESMFPGLVPKQNGAEERLAGAGNDNRGTLNYPASRLRCRAGGARPNILFFVLESWRGGMLDAETTPNMYRFANNSFRFDNHLSGGNVTITGLFSLLYGLHPNYLNRVKAAPLDHQTLLNSTLADLGYRREVYTTSDMSRFAMRPMFFGNIPDSDYHFVETHGKGKNADRAANDREALDLLLQNIEDDPATGDPWYRFVFLTSSHFPYTYPSSHERFQPVGDPGDFVFDKYIDNGPMLNDYRNSLHYLDALFAETIESLVKRGEYEDTLIVVTSDHGEAFNDYGQGYWGHGSDFTWVQNSTPLLVHLPGQQKGEIVSRRSSHIDIASTVLRNGLGCDGDWVNISNGRDLFDLSDHRSMISASYANSAFIVDDNVFIEQVGIKSHGLKHPETGEIPVPYEDIRQLITESRRFIGD